MATVAQAFTLLILTLQIHLFSAGNAKILTITNSCHYTVWPAIITSSGTLSTDDSGFVLEEGESRVVTVPFNWEGKAWGRTICSTDKSTSNFSCQTGDCTTGNIHCNSSFTMPVTLAEFAFSQYNNYDFYDVSLVNGYNLPVLVAPNVESGPRCAATGCIFDLQNSCPTMLRMSQNNVSNIIGCRSPCDVFKTDQYCCNNVTADCQPTNLSMIFKQSCPRAYSYARDDDTSSFYCNGSMESSYNITFCPSPAMSRLLSIPASQALQPAMAPGQDTSPLTVLSPIPSSATTNSTTEPIQQDLPSNTTRRKLHTSMMVAFPTAAAILILLLVVIYLCVSRWKAKEKVNVKTNEMRRFADSLQFDFNTIQLATHNFAAENKLGQGGFGEVYKGELEGGQEVAVKRLSKKSAQGIAEFETEIVHVAGLQHKNLVKLLGYCASPNESLLVYEFLPNSSLDKFLFDPAKKSILNWQTRFNIISGIARGLQYLHEDSRIKIVHRDLKSSNILLDEAMSPKIADFGLARLFEVDQTRADTERIAST